MTSVVDTSVKHFRNDMVNAPVLSGTAGALIALLDAVLVNGFDLKTASSLTVAGGVATLAFSGAHSAMVDSVIVVSGAAPAALNGEQKVTAIAGGVVRFATAVADQSAAGTIAFKLAPLGWSKIFGAGNFAAYKSNDVAATGMVLRVDDTGTTSARVVGYESMSDINNGIGPFPTPVQSAGGAYWMKSSVANGTRVGWTLIGDSRFFALHASIYMGNATPTYDSYLIGITSAFGDAVSLRPGGDPYCCELTGKLAVETTNNPSNGSVDSGAVPYNWFPRSYTTFGGSTASYSYPYVGTRGGGASGMDSSAAGGSLGAAPNPIDGSLRLSKRFFTAVGNSNVAPRADVPGLYTIPQFSILDILTHRKPEAGVGPLLGRNLLPLVVSSGSLATLPDASNSGAVLWDITGPWR